MLACFLAIIFGAPGMLYHADKSKAIVQMHPEAQPRLLLEELAKSQFARLLSLSLSLSFFLPYIRINMHIYYYTHLAYVITSLGPHHATGPQQQQQQQKRTSRQTKANEINGLPCHHHQHQQQQPNPHSSSSGCSTTCFQTCVDFRAPTSGLTSVQQD